jgi:hydroxyethylthiazole kinase-like uncharacterized protein yjeF
MIVTFAEMRAIEEATFASGVAAESLMDTVGRRIASHCLDAFGSQALTVLVYAGKGNNAGDALVAARELRAQHTSRGGSAPLRVRLRLAGGESSLGALPEKKLAALSGADFPRLPGVEGVADIPAVERLVILDGLLGIGASGPLREPLRSAAREINHLRQTAGAYVIAIDTPSGLDAGSGVAADHAVVADETLTVGFAKTGLIMDQAANYTGRLGVIELAEFAPFVSSQAPAAAGRGALITPASLASLLPPRAHESNKGMYGRVGILAGSVGATGAAVMCAHACARAGAGLITLLVHPDIYRIVASAAAPEVMVKPLSSPLAALDMNFDVLALGPGLGQSDAGAVRKLIARWPKPMIIDADGLNILAGDLESLRHAAGARLLTPHPGEMQRLRQGAAADHGASLDKNASRAEIVRQFIDAYPVTLLLKGARTLIGERGRPPAYNTAGNAGLATGGTGDTLTGICAALAGAKLGLFDAARLGAWLHGRAADLAVRASQSEQSLLATDLPAYLGAAFTELRVAGRGQPARLPA